MCPMTGSTKGAATHLVADRGDHAADLTLIQTRNICAWL